MSWQITVPSKTFLLGEYLALVGGPSILLATAPRFMLHAEKSDNLSIPLVGIHSDSPGGKFLKNNSAIFKNYAIKFHDPLPGLGGLGASSAQFVMLATLKNILTQSMLDLTQLLIDYHAVSWNGSGYPPSGADIISQIHGHVVFFHKAIMQVNTFNWPFTDYSFCLLHTGNKIQTHQHLQAIAKIDAKTFKPIVSSGIQALLAKDGAHFADTINQYQQALQQQDFTTDTTKKILHLINNTTGVVAAKGCGALGADVIFVLLENRYCQAFIGRARTEFNIIHAGNEAASGIQILNHGNPVALENVYVAN